MFHFVALVWTSTSDTQSQAAEALARRLRSSSAAWQTVFSRPGIAVYAKGARRGSSEIYALHGGCGVVLGTVFKRSDDCAETHSKAVFGEQETRRIVATKGRDLVASYWGRYVALFCDADGVVRVLRSPTGEIDCLGTCVLGVRTYFSSVEHCPIFDAHKFSINWDYVASDLAVFLPETRATGLTEIERVLHGECIELCAGNSRSECYWSPTRFIEDDRIEDPAVAARSLRTTALACVNAWAGCYDSLLAMLSGGLDSSIVVSLLEKGSTKAAVTCLNYRNPHDAVTDERRYARLVSQATGHSLVELEQCGDFSLAPLLQMPRLASPAQPIFEIGNGARERKLAHGLGAGAFISGHGGDQLFFQHGADYLCADYIHDHGWRPHVLSVALDAARMGGGGLWPTLKRGLRDGLRRHSFAAMASGFRVSPLLRADVAETVRARRLFVPAWLDGTDSVSPGKSWQIFGLASQDDLYAAYALEDDPEYVFPLLSQPLQELCLRIPTYVLTVGGVSRGLARRAFAGDVPADVLRRRTKGFVHDYLNALVATNLQLLTELLMDGVLSKEGIVDREAVHLLLSGQIGNHLASASELLHVACTEGWLRTWSESRQRLAA